jgi:hypothetical protein
MKKLEKFAEQLNGRQYRNEFTEEEKQYAKENGIVIVFGASDDLIEFDGAIYDEAGCWEGGRIWLDKEGNIFNDEEPIKKDGMKYIDIFWCKEGQPFCWLYETKIPHKQFAVLEDNDCYCVGFVFYKKDLGE